MSNLIAGLILCCITFVVWFTKWTLHYRNRRIIRRDPEPIRDPDLIVHVCVSLRD